MKDSVGSIFFSRTRLQENLLLFFCCLIFIGFVGARALISIGVIGIVSTALFTKNFGTTFKLFLNRPILWLPSIFFFILLFSGINSEDKNLWWLWVKTKLPFLFLPIAFAAFTEVNSKTIYKLLYLFSSVVFLSGLWVLINYFLHFQDVNNEILRGGVIPVPYSHIRYSLLLVFALFALVWLLQKGFFFVSISEKYLQLIVILFLFVLLHVLAVRSGLLALYLGIGFLLIKFLLQKNSIRYFIVSVGLFSASLFLAFKFVPSLKNKISYTLYDLNDFAKGNIDDHSDGMRLASLKVGVELIKENFWAGTGAGDILSESKRIAELKFPQIKKEANRKMPHNEFLWTFAATGVFGFLAFCFAFLVPFFYSYPYKNWLFVILYIIYFSSFLTEYSLEEQIGSAFYLIFLLLFLQHFQTLKTDNA